MEKIKVVEHDRYRDGGTVVYRDQLNRLYYTWHPLRPKVFNDYPYRPGQSKIPAPWVLEIPIELEIVESF